MFLPSLSPFPLCTSICARWHRTPLLPSNPFDTYLSAFSPYPSRPLSVLGPCQKPAAGWVLRLRCSQAFAAIALVPATACAQKQARRRYSLQTPRSPFQATLPSRSPSKSGDQERKLSSINLQLFFVPSGSGSSGTVRHSIFVFILHRTCGRRHSRF